MLGNEKSWLLIEQKHLFFQTNRKMKVGKDWFVAGFANESLAIFHTN